MSTPLLSMNRAAGAALETVPGTAVAAVFDVELYDFGSPELDYAFASLGKPAIGNMQKGKQYSGAVKVTAKGKDALRFPATSATVPKNGKFLLAAGYRQGLDGAAVQYTHDGTPAWKTLSIEVVDKAAGTSPTAILKKMKGAVCNAVISAANVGAPIAIEYSFGGASNGETDTATLPTIAGVDDADAEKFLGAVIDFDGVAYCVNNFSLDLGNTLTPITCPNETLGVIGYEITDCNPKLSLSLRKMAIATTVFPSLMVSDDILTGWKISTTHFDIEIVKGQMIGRKDADTDGQVFEALEFQIDSHTITLK